MNRLTTLTEFVISIDLFHRINVHVNFCLCFPLSASSPISISPISLSPSLSLKNTSSMAWFSCVFILASIFGIRHMPNRNRRRKSSTNMSVSTLVIKSHHKRTSSHNQTSKVESFKLNPPLISSQAHNKAIHFLINAYSNLARSYHYSENDTFPLTVCSHVEHISWHSTKRSLEMN